MRMQAVGDIINLMNARFEQLRQEDGSVDIIEETGGVAMKKCVFCGSSAQKKTITFTYEGKDSKVII